MDRSVKLYPGVQRALLVFVGLIFLFLGIEGVIQGPIAARILYGAMLLGSVWFIYRGARLGLTIDRHGITERSLERTRRAEWSELGEPTVVQQTGNTGIPFHVVVVARRAGGEIRLPATARFSRDAAQRIRDRMAELRALAEPPSA